MNWTQLLKKEIETTYTATEKLLDKVNANSLAWKPATGTNWMTIGQLLMHLGYACGAGCKGFVTGDWGLPPDTNFEDLTPEQMLPPADQMPSAESVEQAKKLLAEDKALAIEMIDRAGEDDLANKQVIAPWIPNVTLTLGHYLLQMVQHLDRHKSQLFYYLKLQEKPVNTGDLWG